MISVIYLLFRKCLEVVTLVASGMCLCHTFNNHVSDYVLRVRKDIDAGGVPDLVLGGSTISLGCWSELPWGRKTFCQPFDFYGSQ